MSKEEIKRDIQAFADDISAVLIDNKGNILFTRNGKDYECSFETDSTSGVSYINYEGKRVPYRKFIAKDLAHLEVLATKLLEKKDIVEPFVDGPSVLRFGSSTLEGSALQLLDDECKRFLEFGTKITFLTADAGHGKTALLKQYQKVQAERYLRNESDFLFWHIDLQGRELVRLAEAISLEIGNLRLQGIYYSSIINLLKHRLLILAIDGFDELAAEIGGTQAIGALSSLVAEMDGNGSLVAASRRTFFDTQDYLKKTKFLKGMEIPECEFDELIVKDWTQKEVTEYLAYFFPDPVITYKSILTELHGEQKHPILCRPFLLAKVAEGLVDSNCEPSQFFSKVDENSEGVSEVVEAFTRREVEKWKERDTKTGKPYLTYEQHITLLSTIAKEMWEAKKESIGLDEIHFYTTVLIEGWKIDTSLRPMILRMVDSHAFLIPLSDSKPNFRKFDHEEFKNYFLARSLAEQIEQAAMSPNIIVLRKFLYTDQLPDSVAKYCFDYIQHLEDKIESILAAFKSIIDSEWKPTYLQSNIGTMIPYLLDNRKSEKLISIDAKVNYSSLIFENKHLKNIEISNGTFINISLRETFFENTKFLNCEFNQIRITKDSNLGFKSVVMQSCNITSVVVLEDGEAVETAFAPTRIKQLLGGWGIEIKNGVEVKASSDEVLKDSDFKKAVYRFLQRFNKTVFQYEKSIEIEKQFGPQSEIILKDVIPFLAKQGIIEQKETKHIKQSNSKAWALRYELEEILKADENANTSNLGKFWQYVNQQ
ncbi:MAG: NACHT domain-containing protein [Cytophagales bacterium]|nr:NACHT domain-containing protein [Cytophagales bacterium]